MRSVPDSYPHANMFSEWNTSISVEFLQENVNKRTLAQIYRVIYEQEARCCNKSRLFIKESEFASYASYVLSHFPDAKYVYMARDPRDMALWWKESCREDNSGSAIKEAVNYWKKEHLGSIRLYSYLMDLQKVHFLKFEHLLTDSENQIGRICEFLGLEYTSEMLNFYQDDLLKKNSDKMFEWGDLQKPIQADNVNNYKTKLNEPEIRYIEMACRKEMDYLGYECDYDDLISFKELEPQITDKIQREERPTSVEEEAYRDYFDSVKRIEEGAISLKPWV